MFFLHFEEYIEVTKLFVLIFFISVKVVDMHIMCLLGDVFPENYGVCNSICTPPPLNPLLYPGTQTVGIFFTQLALYDK